uniref:Uncharacterized protein n=1 Tax=Trypanosoma brucei TaxID=5691 RepID=Q582Y7_9TRYP|nr:hypothetical protein, unlikely [Trypanosoma brucei]
MGVEAATSSRSVSKTAGLSLTVSSALTAMLEAEPILY